MSDIQVKINDELFHAGFDEKNPRSVRIGEKNYEMELVRDHGNNVRTYLINNKIATIQADENTDGNYRILYNNFEYNAEIKTETRALLEKFLKGSGALKGEGAVKAPMPGLVVKIQAEIGDEVSEGDKVVIIEAMKMENALAAPISGKVSAIKVKEGDAVDKGAVLLEIEGED